MQDKSRDEQVPENVKPQVPANQQPGPFYPGGQPVYYPVYSRPKVPGKGLGIASMVLGIIGIVYSGLLFLIGLQAMLYSFVNTSHIDVYESMKKIMVNLFDSDSMENLLAFIFTSAVFTVLACIFALVSLKRGYRNKISKAGLILSIVSFALIALFVVFIGFVCPEFWVDGMNAMK